MSLKSYKDKQYLIFEFEDGKTVKYNLATGESIGKSGRPVKNVCSQLRGYNLLEVIDSFSDENYRDFLKFVDSRVNRSTSRNMWRGSNRVNRITNIGSFLMRINDYSLFEQYYACGIKNVDENVKYAITSIPKGLLGLIREDDIKVTNILIESYISNPSLFMNIYNLEVNSLSKGDILRLSKTIKQLDKDYNGLSYWHHEEHYFINLIVNYNYSPIRLIKYVDSLITLEALSNNLQKIFREIEDYARMMSRISEKYDKYPKNFLTTHVIASRNYNRLSQIFKEEDFLKARDESLEFSANKELVVIYPKTTKDIKDEAVQQNHCVASYIDGVIEGRCHILFLRNKEKLGESLITIEVRNFEIVQARGRFNRDPNEKEKKALEEYQLYLYKIKKQKEIK